MKTRMILVAMLLLAFGTSKAQVNEPQQLEPKNDSTVVNGELDMLMRELGVNLEYLSDSVDWKSFEEGMEKWEKDMERRGKDVEKTVREMEKKARKMEKKAREMEKKAREMEKKAREMEKHGKRQEYHYGYHNDQSAPSGCGTCEAKKNSKRSLLFDSNWSGFEAGLNMLFNTPSDVANANNVAQSMELRPLRSWYFGFNIADVGIAFNRRHTAGLFTGVGLGWNNFNWNNSITVEYDPENAVYTFDPIVSDQVVKNSKHGALFLQVPLMIEVRPTRSLYIDAGVTGGLRIAQWNRVKFANGTRIKRYYGSNINHFKLDASLRVGSDDLGFFANFALLPIFDMNNTKVHPISFGFSINF